MRRSASDLRMASAPEMPAAEERAREFAAEANYFRDRHETRRPNITNSCDIPNALGNTSPTPAISGRTGWLRSYANGHEATWCWSLQRDQP
jgi:hypothetical protein